ncbi:membrane protein insertase YidC [Blattabacterium cuenoti]|uniref:membrane protein insertase YidC n=1 Tax=Blattabacterium cuenoti TaxID=1653831 RepID=UPI00163B6AFC|nr:membrane protein insertase YidC [Blattabacterium cuenoti]
MKVRNLDYNSIIGLFLILSILIFFTYFNKENIENKKYVKKKKIETFFLKNSNNRNSKTKDFILENKVLRLKVTSLGGSISEVFLKKYKAYDANYLVHKKNLYLIKDSSFLYNMAFPFSNKKGNEKLIHTNSLLFYPFFFKNEKNFTILVMRAKNPYNNGFIEHIYILKSKNQYDLDFQIRTINLSSSFKIGEEASINLEQKIFSLEKDKKWENSYTQVYYSTINNNENRKIKYLSEKEEEEKKITDLNWLANKQQFFASIFIFKKPFDHSFVRSENFLSGPFLKKVKSKFLFKIKKNKEIKILFRLYFGPLDFSFLKKYDQKIENIIPFGWGFLKWINKYFFLLIFSFLEKTNLNYGIIIILMTIVVKLILSPITYKQYKLSAMMKFIRPEIDNINNKFKNYDTLIKQREIIKLYKKAGINPMSGCFSAIFQIPIFYSLFKFFPTLINLRGKHFLWVKDLTSYDSILELPFFIPFYGNHVSLLTLLYSIALLVYTKLSNNEKNNYSEDISNMDFLLYFMPVVMLLFINSYASGLSLYYFTSNVINIGLIFFIKKYMLNENKIRQKIQERQKRN